MAIEVLEARLISKYFGRAAAAAAAPAVATGGSSSHSESAITDISRIAAGIASPAMPPSPAGVRFMSLFGAQAKRVDPMVAAAFSSTASKGQ